MWPAHGGVTWPLTVGPEGDFHTANHFPLTNYKTGDTVVPKLFFSWPVLTHPLRPSWAAIPGRPRWG